MTTDSIQHWPKRLDAVVRALSGRFASVTVLHETDSTQDAARRLNAGPGDVITTGRQMSGRGRLGRAWMDGAGAGVAVTIVIDARPPESLAIATAIGVARAVESLLDHAVGIKWPNDIVVQGRKLAGILVERDGERMFIGIGLNVTQTDWPPHLNGCAVSLRELGCDVDRVEVIASILTHLDSALALGEDDLADEFARRDVLRGETATFLHSGAIYDGRVLRIDPLRGLEVETASGPVTLPAATTSVVVPAEKGTD